MTNLDDDKYISLDHQPIISTGLSGLTEDTYVEIGERLDESEVSQVVRVSAQDIPGLITWLTQQWSALNSKTEET